MSRVTFFLVVVVAVYGNELDISSEDFNAEYSSGNKLVLSDWDSTLYGKPICVPIPSNMSLCANINYNQMKIPNLLNHDTIDEIQYQSSAWMPLLSINCHKDTQLFLCSLFAPVCVEQAAIYPCRSLCEAVKQSCEGQMLTYNYPWPAMFNCSNFPEDNGLCIQPSSQMSTGKNSLVPTSTTTVKPTTTTITTTTTTTSVTPIVKQDSSNKVSQINTCVSCEEGQVSLEEIVINYCNSDVALRGRVQSIKSSRFDLVSPKLKKGGRNKVSLNKTLSSYLVIPKRDRKVIKGARLLSPAQLGSYLNDKSLVKMNRDFNNEYEEDEEDEDESQHNKEIEMYLLSSYHLKLVPNDAKSARSLNFESRQMKNKSRLNGKKITTQQDSNKRSTLMNGKFCRCEKLRKNLRRSNMKYLIMANILKIRRNLVKLADGSFNERRIRRDLSNETIVLNTTSTTTTTTSLINDELFQALIESGQIKRNVKVHSKKWANESQRKHKVLFVTSVVQWNRARAFIDYLEDESIDKSEMCTNVKNTVDEINRAQRFLL